LRHRLAGWLVHPRLPVHLALLAIALCLPALGVGWQLDDYFHRVPQVRQEFVDLGIFPWWTADGFRLAFFRYLSAATAWLDYRLWPDSAVLQHSHNLLWLGALIAVATLFYRRVEGSTRVAGLAALLYAVDDAHGAAAGWIANRNALIACFFGVLCLVAHDRWRRSEGGGARLSAILAPLFFSLALAAGEMGLGAAAFLVAHAAFLDRAALRGRLASLVPCGGVLLLWAALYRLLGFGAASSGLYVDPGGQPVEFGRLLVARAPFYLAGQLTPLPAELGSLVPARGQAMAWWSVTLALVVMAAILAPLVRRSRRARFWALGATLSVVPLCATFPASRVLFFAGLGGMGLVARWLEGFWWRRAEGRAHWPARIVAVGLVATHLILAPLNLPFSVRAFELFGEPVTAAIRSLPQDDALADQGLVVVNAPEYLSYVSQAGSVLLLDGRPVPRTIRGLAIGPSAVSASRVDESTLDLSMAQGYLCGPLGALFHDSLEPLAVGESFAVPGMTATVMAATASGAPATVRFRFDDALESPSRRWVQFLNGRFVPFTPPAAGESIELPAALGPFELFFGGG
jgi:hypothetical protein